MRTVTRTRIVVVVGAHPRISAEDVLGDVGPGEEAAVFVLGLDPTPGQRRLTGSALALAAERRFVLTAELIPASTWLRQRLRHGDEIRPVTRRREARRWGIEPGPVVNARGA
jgi:hypothetical protein